MKFVIVSPRQKWGGAIALHVLTKYLDENGHNARVFYTEEYCCGNKKYISWLKWFFKWIQYSIRDYKEEKKRLDSYVVQSVRRKYLPFITKDTIVVYPDTVYGNPLHAEKVVRWLLYYNRYKGDSLAYGKNDLFVCYRQQFNDEVLNPDRYELYTPYFDLDFYKRTNFGERKGTCYVIRKGQYREDLPKSFDGPIIDDMSEKRKVEIFNECEKCISYDTQTAYSGIAAMCGCLSIVVPEKGKQRSDYLSYGEIGYGRAYGFDKEEIEFAKQTSHLVEENYRNSNKKGKESVNKFIKLCEEYFG